MQVSPNWIEFKELCNYLEVRPKLFKKRFLALDSETQEFAIGILKVTCMAFAAGITAKIPNTETVNLLVKSMENGEAPAVRQWIFSPLGCEPHE